MKIRRFPYRRWLAGLLALAACAVMLTGCGKKASDEVKIIDAYIDGFTKFYVQGNEYTDLGLQLQADYAYGWAAASVSAMRCCVDHLIDKKGASQPSGMTSSERITDWETIAELSYASPYPWYFEGLTFSAEGNNADARVCYENALLNPAFSAEHDEALSVLLVLPVEDLEAIQKS